MIVLGMVIHSEAEFYLVVREVLSELILKKTI